MNVLVTEPMSNRVSAWTGEPVATLVRPYPCRQGDLPVGDDRHGDARELALGQIGLHACATRLARSGGGRAIPGLPEAMRSRGSSASASGRTRRRAPVRPDRPPGWVRSGSGLGRRRDSGHRAKDPFCLSS